MGQCDLFVVLDDAEQYVGTYASIDDADDAAADFQDQFDMDLEFTIVLK